MKLTDIAPAKQTTHAHRTALLAAWFLGKLKQDIPNGIAVAVEDKESDDIQVDFILRNVLAEVRKDDVELFDKLLNEDSAASAALYVWWVDDQVAVRNWAEAPLMALRKLKRESKDGMIPVEHIAGHCTHWIREGTRSWPDPKSRTHHLQFNFDDFVVRDHDDAGGTVTHLVKATNHKTCITYDIVRVTRTGLAVGHVDQPNHLPTWFKPVPKPEAEASL